MLDKVAESIERRCAALVFSTIVFCFPSHKRLMHCLGQFTVRKLGRQKCGLEVTWYVASQRGLFSSVSNTVTTCKVARQLSITKSIFFLETCLVVKCSSKACQRSLVARLHALGRQAPVVMLQCDYFLNCPLYSTGFLRA